MGFPHRDSEISGSAKSPSEIVVSFLTCRTIGKGIKRPPPLLLEPSVPHLARPIDAHASIHMSLETAMRILIITVLESYSSQVYCEDFSRSSRNCPATCSVSLLE